MDHDRPSDYLLFRGVPVEFIMGPGVVPPGTTTPGARVMLDGSLCYSTPVEDNARL